MRTPLYNAVSLMKSSLAAAHSEEAVDNISWYYAYTETQAVWSGMEIALPFEFWSERFDAMPDEEFCGYLRTLSSKIDVSKFTKSQRGPKKKVTKARPARYLQTSWRNGTPH